MKMHTKLSVFGAALSLTVIMVSATAAASILRAKDNDPPEPESVAEQNAGAEENTKESGYWVCAPGDFVEVYDGINRSRLLETTGITVRTLRLADQALLRDGVLLPDRETLLHFLEDFGP